jgi:asparaginyl-tRNA synthetase
MDNDYILFKKKYDSIMDIGTSCVGEEKRVQGTVRSFRVQSGIIFVELFDSSSSAVLQLISEDKSIVLQLDGSISNGASLFVKGTVRPHEKRHGQVELIITEILHIGSVYDPKRCILNSFTTLKNLRNHRLDWGKTRTGHAVLRISAGVMRALTDTFHTMGFSQYRVNSLTISDCEGAGDMFFVSSNIGGGAVPLSADGTVDWSKDFFGQKVGLTVSQQWGLELYVQSEDAAFTFGTSWRAEKSDTNRHAAEFGHVEFEKSWASLDDLININESLVKCVVDYVLKNHMVDLEELNKKVSVGIIDRLKGFLERPFIRITYDTAIELVEKHGEEIRAKFSQTILPVWGDDLGSTCERYIADVVYGHPVFIFNYPKTLKSFYMKQNTDKRTVQGCDLIMNGVGELFGSSVRESDYDKLVLAAKERNMSIEPIQWYLDMRRNGYKPSAGAGMGFERLLMAVTGIDNLRDVGLFPMCFNEKPKF